MMRVRRVGFADTKSGDGENNVYRDCIHLTAAIK